MRLTNHHVYYDNLTVVSQITAEEWPLEGVWIASAPTPLGSMIKVSDLTAILPVANVALVR